MSKVASCTCASSSEPGAFAQLNVRSRPDKTSMKYSPRALCSAIPLGRELSAHSCQAPRLCPSRRRRWRAWIADAAIAVEIVGAPCDVARSLQAHLPLRLQSLLLQARRTLCASMRAPPAANRRSQPPQGSRACPQSARCSPGRGCVPRSHESAPEPVSPPLLARPPHWNPPLGAGGAGSEGPLAS
jgi:hypothetical protein